MSGGRLGDSVGAEKAGTGGRGGVAGGAFSLSVAWESWLDMAFEVLGREGRSVVADVVGFGSASAGGLGKSLMIWRSQRCEACV
jgi:hypothetical protein